MSNNESLISMILEPHTLLDEVNEWMDNPPGERGGLLPWIKSHDKFRLRKGELTIWYGYNGAGKSQVLGQIVNHLMGQQIKSSIMSIEMKPAATMSRMIQQGAAKKVTGHDYREAFLKHCRYKTYVYGGMGVVTPDFVVDYIYAHFAVDGYRMADHIFIDPLTQIRVVKNRDNPSPYTDMAEFISTLSAMAKQLDIGIHLVAHARKALPAAGLTTALPPPGRYDIRGAGEISDLADNCIGVYRNQLKESAQAKVAEGHKIDAVKDSHFSAGERREVEGWDVKLIVDKQRHHDYTGVIGLHYHHDSLQLSEHWRKPQGVIDL